MMVLWISKAAESTASALILKQSLLQKTADKIHLTDQRDPTEDNKLSDIIRPLNRL